MKNLPLEANSGRVTGPGEGRLEETGGPMDKNRIGRPT
jgi:hypothetical protein